MAKSLKPPSLDPDGKEVVQHPSGLTPFAAVFTAVRTDPQSVICKVCPSRSVCKKFLIRRCHIASHIQSKKHQKNLREARKQDIPLKLGTHERSQSIFSLPVETPAWDTFTIVPDTHPSLPPFDSSHRDPEVPFGQAWDEFEAKRTVHIDDYFNEIHTTDD
jgi:hypothetical protein